VEELLRQLRERQMRAPLSAGVMNQTTKRFEKTMSEVLADIDRTLDMLRFLQGKSPVASE
jgi:hypothetical protein